MRYLGDPTPFSCGPRRPDRHLGLTTRSPVGSIPLGRTRRAGLRSPAVWEADEQGLITAWSATASTLLRLGAAEAIGAPLSDVLVWDSAGGLSPTCGPDGQDVILFRAPVSRRPERTIEVAWSNLDPARPGEGLFCAADAGRTGPSRWQDPVHVRPIHDPAETVLVCDESATILHVIFGTDGLLGYDRRQLVGRRVPDLVGTEDVQAWLEMWSWTLWSSRLQSVIAIASGPAGLGDVEYTAINRLAHPGTAAIVVYCRQVPSPTDLGQARPA